jgi:hypothetical protein
MRRFFLIPSFQIPLIWILCFPRYYPGDQIKDKISETCGIVGGNDISIKGFGKETRKKEITLRDHFEDVGVVGRNNSRTNSTLKQSLR